MRGYSEKCPFCVSRFTVRQKIKDHVRSQHPRQFEHWQQVTGRAAMLCKSCRSTGFPPKWGRTAMGNEFLGCEFCCQDE